MSVSKKIDLICSSHQPGCSACINKLNAYAEESSPLELIEALANLPENELRAKQQKALSERAHAFVMRAFALQEFNRWDESAEIEKESRLLTKAQEALERLKATSVQRQKELSQLLDANQKREALITTTISTRKMREQGIAQSDLVINECKKNLVIIEQKTKIAKAGLKKDKERLADLSPNNTLWRQCVIL